MFSRSRLVLFQNNNGFEMMGVGKHIHRLDRGDCKSTADQFLQVTDQSGGIAADIDDPLAGQTSDKTNQFSQAPAWRIADDGFKRFSLRHKVPAC